MQSQRGSFVVDYLVKRTAKPWDAKIYALGKEVADIRRGESSTYIVRTKGKDAWILSRSIKGEIKPFSMEVMAIESSQAHGKGGAAELVITDHLFEHRGKVYMLTSSPEGRPLRDFVLGKRYICRLDNFPLSGLAEIDYETRSRLRKFRGVPVGEMDGLGTEGHHVRLSEELEDIGLPLSASCYLLYSTA